MPSRRSPSQRTTEGRQGRQMAALSTGTNAGRLISASRRPTAAGATPPVAPPTDGHNGVTLFYRDRFTTVSSVATLVLTHAPLDYSAHVYLNGFAQDEGTDYTISGQILTILSGMSRSSGDILDVRYAYDTGAIGFNVIVPFLASGWSYNSGGAAALAGFQATGYSVSSWSTGAAGFGYIGTAAVPGIPITVGTTINTAGYGDIVIRRTLTTSVAGKRLRLTFHSDDNLAVWLNGTLLFDNDGEAHSVDALIPPPLLIPGSSVLGNDVLAVRLRDRYPNLGSDPGATGNIAFIDVQVESET